MSTKQKRIAFFLTMFYGGGGERVVFDLAKGFLASGYKVDFVVVKREGKLAGAIPDGVTVVELSSKRLISSIRPLAAYLRRERPAAILAISEHAHLVMLAAAMLARVTTKTVVRIGIPFSVLFKRYRSWKDRLVPFAGRFLYPRADIIIANSKGAADDFARTLGIDRERIEVIYNPKDIKAIQRLAQEPPSHPWFAQKDMPVIIGVGRLAHQKGFDILIEALSKMREDARLILVGDGGEREALREQAENLRVFERVAFVGFVENPYPYLARADVFVLPSRWEGFPNALVEALALGIPAVAADCPYGPRELLAPESDYRAHTTDGVEQAGYGFLVPIEDHRALAQALDMVLSNVEPGAHYGATGKQYVEAFALSSIVEQYERTLCGGK